MDRNFNLDELNQFSGSDVSFQHWFTKMCYTEGVSYLANKVECYWLIEEIACVILPRLLKENKDRFYSIQFVVNSNQSADMTIGDGNDNIYLRHKITWTDFPIVNQIIQFYLCDTGSYYCLMLPSEY